MNKFDNIHSNKKELKENSTVVNTDSINGMGEIKLPSLDGTIGSGDTLGATSDKIVFTQLPAKTIAMKKFKVVKEDREINEKEIYIPITDISDPSTLISTIAKELAKNNKSKEKEIVKELTNIEISYNGIVNIFSLGNLPSLLNLDSKTTKKEIDSLIDKHINLLESLQVEFITKLINDPSSINEGILGRAIGGLAGFALGPKVGRLIAKVLGVEQGPLYNLLTSRIVSAAMAQELTKNIA